MDVTDHYYIVNGEISSTFREIDKIVERSKVEALVATSKLQSEFSCYNLLPLPAPNLMVNSPENIESKLYNSKQIIFEGRFHHIKLTTDWKRVNFLQYIQCGGDLDHYPVENLPTAQETFCYNLDNEESNRKYVSSKSNTGNHNDLGIEDMFDSCPLDGLEKREQLLLMLLERNFWFKLFYYFQNKFRVPIERRRYMSKILADFPYFYEKLKLFGYNLLLLENERINNYSFKLLQEVYKQQEVEFEKDKLQMSMAMEFVESNLAESVIKACEENYFHCLKQRMNYTRKF